MKEKARRKEQERAEREKLQHTKKADKSWPTSLTNKYNTIFIYCENVLSFVFKYKRKILFLWKCYFKIRFVSIENVPKK